MARATLTLLAAGLCLCNCGGKKPETTAETKAAPAYFKVDASTAANLSGKVILRGKRPRPALIRMDAESACAQMHKGGVLSEEVVADAGGLLANVFVWIKTGLEGETFAPPTGTIRLDQNGCMFRPRVLGIRTGQTLVVANSDPVTHNVHPMPKDNREWNQGQAAQAPNLERRFARPEVMIPVKCNVHAWMKAYIGVVDHPYFAVTGKEGTFELRGLPPGDYTVGAWHEKFGAQEQKVTLALAGSQAVDFIFSGQ